MNWKIIFAFVLLVLTILSFVCMGSNDDGDDESQDAGETDTAQADNELDTTEEIVVDPQVDDTPDQGQTRRVQKHFLVFGGNGFLGSETVKLLIDNHENITMVNRGNWYWDSYDRIRPYVNRHISCDRKNDLESCEELVKLVADSNGFDAVIDFSAYEGKESKESSSLLKGKTKLYIMISTDSVYDVTNKDHDEFSKETDCVRPGEEEERQRLAYHHEYGNKKLMAEEQLIQQRWDSDDGIPYVVLRLPDVFGPRDTTFRWWLYQLWIKLESHGIGKQPLSMAPFLVDYNMSLVYSKDVAKLVVDLVSTGPEVHDQVFNVAFPDTKTINDVVMSIRKNLGIEHSEIQVESNQSKTLFVYPSVRKGPVDVSKLQNMLSWEPTTWDEAVEETVEFFESAMTNDRFSVQRDEIVQVLTAHLYLDHEDDVYESLENIYQINLHHFKPKVEL